jgi:WD40 repeat protein
MRKYLLQECNNVMKPNREEFLLELALKKPADKRVAFLDAMCEGDPALRQRLEAMLAEHERSAECPAPEESTSDAPPERSHAEGPGKMIDRYKLLEKVGEGGFGVIYVAEQREPVRRRVALKIIKLGMDTKQVVARFEAERQALAMMEHPNIAKVLDAGATETGRPYFVMELVRGIPITEYCDQERLDTRQRLDLFIQVCHAIQHAHQKGIIHRDIKPSNILVTLHDGVPVPKVIDFGIAKAIQHDLTDKTVYTRLQQFVGTPAYVSPEQAEMSGLDVDTRSDIYSLGVLLYELLTSRTPFDPDELMKGGVDVMRKVIRETEPPKPSTKVATLAEEDRSSTAARQAADVPKLIGLLKGDLDWIVMKCLEKDRTRRYETANGLAMDLQRHLNNESVVARPPSAVYRLQKAWRRNKVIYTAAMLAVLSLIAGIAMSLWQARRAEVNEQIAIQARNDEESLRRQAQQRAYASDMVVAKQALDESNLERALNLLNQQRPRSDKEDLRGWEWRYLWKQTRSDALYPLCRQSNPVTSLAVSADANWLAIGGFITGNSSGSVLSLWNLQSRQEMPADGLPDKLGDSRVAFSPTNPLLAFTSSGRLGQPPYTLRLWNVTTQRMTAEKKLDEYCIGLAFSADGRRLVTSTRMGQITLWRIPELTRLNNPYPSEQAIFGPFGGFATTPDLNRVAYGLPDGRIRVLDLNDGSELWTKEAGKDSATALAFSPDGETLASAGVAEYDIRLWDVATGEEKSGRLEGHKSWVSSLVFWPDGKKLASGSADQTIRIWNVAERSCRDVLHGHQNEVWQLALLPDGKKLVSGYKDGTVCLWDTSVRHAKPPRITIPENVQTWCFTPDSRSVLTLNPEGQVTRWEGDDFQQRTQVLDIGDSFNGSLFSRDGRYLATGSSNGVISIWDLSQGGLCHRLQGEMGIVTPVRFFAQGRKLLTRSQPGNLLRAWNVVTEQKLYSWITPRLSNYFLAPDLRQAVGISPDSTHALLMGWGEFLYADLINGGEEPLNLEPIGAVSGAAFSPDGKLFAVSSLGSLMQVWDTDTWQEEVKLRGYMQALFSVTFSPDGSRLVSGGGRDEALRFWDTKSWRDVLTLTSDAAGFYDIHFSPDGSIIGSQSIRSTRGTLQLWRAPSWEEINIAEANDKMDLLQP